MWHDADENPSHAATIPGVASQKHLSILAARSEMAVTAAAGRSKRRRAISSRTKSGARWPHFNVTATEE